MTTEPIFVVSWLSQTSDFNCAGVAPKAFKTRKEAEEHLKWVLEAERNDWASRMGEDEFKCDFERGQIYDNAYEEIFTAEVKETDLCY